MNQQTPIRGYKVFNPDFTCKEMKFEVGKTFEVSLPIEICKHGLHFCIKASHCFSYYTFDSNNIVCEVEALGEVMTHGEDSKICTNKLHIIRRLTWDEVLQVANDGKNNTGHSNTGDRNTGDRNTGDRNTGYSNTGDWNTGDRNTGYRNTGDWNTGDWNTGYSNTGDRNTGAFCTGEQTIKIFNKESGWSHQDFLNSKVYSLLCEVGTKMWIYSENMSQEEKEKFPSHKTTGGYLKDIPYKDAFQNKWHNWNEGNKKAFMDLPHFDKDIFFQITGVKID